MSRDSFGEMPSFSRKCHILVTLGPTWEWIDPLRFLTNRATGTLGYRIAQEGLRRGHRLTCVAGPTALDPLPGVRWVNVVSARDMDRAVVSAFSKADVLVMCAAVSDYRVKHVSRKKRKRAGKSLTLVLQENPDIIGRLSRRKGKRLFVGFALETESLFKNAVKKLREKKLDLVVANLLGRGSNPFGDRRVSVSFLWKDGRKRRLRSVSKRQVAAALLDAIEELLSESVMAT